MSTLTPDIAELNQRRRRAVELRLDGLTLNNIKESTGLSVPTIISAWQAFVAGGWQAIDVAARGRPRGDGRVLSAEQEAELRHSALHTPPEQHGQPAGLWDVAALQTLAQQRWGAELNNRAATRLLERWQLGAQGLRETAERHPAHLDWLDTTWQSHVKRGQQGGARPWWAGSINHPDVPAPGGVRVAITPRGSLHWLGTRHLSSAADIESFLERLPEAHSQGACVHLHGVAFGASPRLLAWLAARPHIEVLACPVAPARPQAKATTPVSAPAAVPKPAVSSLSIPPRTDHPMSLTHLQRLEAESIHIMREVVAEADNPVMLYSIGKDSAVMLHLARKAFYPAPPPFPLLHVDTTWKFRAMYEMRDRMAKELGMDLLVHHNPEAQELGINPFTHGSQIHTDMWKTQGLKQALDKYNFDVAFGGARRDEEKSRAKERIFSFRSAQHRWDPKNQRPELWRLYNGRKQKGESIRCFPISNWTELDIWQYIHLENIPIVPLYMAAERPVVDRDGTLIMVDDDRFPLREGEVPMMKKVRFRTLGCYPLSGAVESEAESLTDIIQEMLLTRTSERQGRMIDHDAAASMEKKKQEGYF